MTLNEIVKQAYETAVAKGWHSETIENDAAVFGSKLALIHSEVSEALEAYRDRGLEETQRDDGKPEGVLAELADVIIRIGDLVGMLQAQGFNVDLEDAIIEKMNFNKTRPYRHGGKRL